MFPDISDPFGVPPHAIPNGCVPNPIPLNLPVFISPTSVQDEPFHDSTIDLGVGLPPAIIAAVLVPNPALLYLALFKSPTSVQLEPFHDSLTAV